MLAFLQRINRPVWALLAVAAIAGAMRFAGLSSPKTRVFDEFYYSKAACILLGEPNATCGVRSDDEKFWRRTKWDVGSWVHPPLGKWMIAMGEKIAGADSPFGWRLSAAICGTAMCVMVAGIAQLLWGRPIWSFVAGVLMSVESLDFVLSRLSLLDVFVAFWVVAAFLLLLLDRRWIERRTPAEARVETPAPQMRVAVGVGAPALGGMPEAPTTEPEPVPRPPRVPSPVWRPWRFAAGAALGAAAAVKWSGAYSILGAVLLTVAWETSRRRVGGRTRGQALWRAFLWESFGVLLAFLVTPIAIYLATWLPWFHHFGWSLHAWWQNEVDTWRFHHSLTWTSFDPKLKEYTPSHPYFSHWYTWLYMERPVSMFAKRYGDTQREILAIGNPAIMWASAITIPYLAWAWLGRHKDWRGGFVLLAIASGYLPWAVFSRPQFFFYLSPVTPFLVLAAVYVLRELSDARIVLRDVTTGETIASTKHPYRPFVWIYVGLAVALFAWFYPVLVGTPISLEHWHLIVWFPSWV